MPGDEMLAHLRDVVRCESSLRQRRLDEGTALAPADEICALVVAGHVESLESRGGISKWRRG